MDRQYVGIDFHRRRSVIVRLDTDGARLGLHRTQGEGIPVIAYVHPWQIYRISRG